MKAMILAAGRGRRLRPLTDFLPKPLVQVGGQPLITYHLEALARAGFEEVVVNLAWRGEDVRNTLGSGADWGIQIHYSEEPVGALDTGGGIRNALPLLGEEPFLVINADVFTDHPLDTLSLPTGRLAHLVLVDNPPHRPEGDFALEGDAVSVMVGERLTFSGIGVYHPELFSGQEEEAFPLTPLLVQAMRAGWVSGERYAGTWVDVGTPERLEEADAMARQRRPGTQAPE